MVNPLAWPNKNTVVVYIWKWNADKISRHCECMHSNSNLTAGKCKILHITTSSYYTGTEYSILAIKKRSDWQKHPVSVLTLALAYPSLIVMFLSSSFLNLTVCTPEIAFTTVDFPWATWPMVPRRTKDRSQNSSSLLVKPTFRWNHCWCD